MRSIVKGVAVTVGMCSLLQTAAAHETFVAQNADNQLIFVLDEHLEVPVPLDVSAFPGIPGFAADEPGLVALEESIDGADPINPLSEIELIFLGGDPEIQMWGEGADDPLAPGETLYLGLAPFHVHAIWNIHNGQLGGVYELNFQFRDRSGIAMTSEPVSLSFTAVPEPGSLLMLAGAATMMLRRRR